MLTWKSPSQTARCCVAAGLAVAAIVATGCGSSSSSSSSSSDGAAAQTASAGSSSGGGVRLRYATVLAPEALGNSDLVKTIIDKTRGKLDIQPNYNGALGGEQEELQGVQAGTIDMALITDATIASVNPGANIAELPYFWKNQQAVNNILIEGPVGKELLDSLSAKGMHGLAISNLGPRTFLSTKPIHTASDVSGLKVRVLPSDLFVKEWSNWGANPVQVDAPEVPTALQTGTVQAADSNATGFASLKWYQGKAHYLAKTDHAYTVQFLVMNQAKWDSLPDSAKQALESAAAQGVKLNEQRATAGDQAAIKTMADHGVKVTEPDRSSFLPGAHKTWSEFEGAIGADLMQKAKDLQANVK